MQLVEQGCLAALETDNILPHPSPCGVHFLVDFCTPQCPVKLNLSYLSLLGDELDRPARGIYLMVSSLGGRQQDKGRKCMAAFGTIPNISHREEQSRLAALTCRISGVVKPPVLLVILHFYLVICLLLPLFLLDVIIGQAALMCMCVPQS